MTTQYANASYQEVIDLHTESDTVSVVGIHTPNTDTPVKMLHGFWEQFRKFKYNGCSISLVPAARLPADPLQVSYSAGSTTLDPRDMLNPILFHGCHGNDMGAILNTMYNTAGYSTNEITRQYADSVDENVLPAGNVVGNSYVEALYYRALTDKTWLKAHPQKGFRKSGLHPMVYSMASTVQFGPSDAPNLGRFLPRGNFHSDVDGDPYLGISNNAGLNGTDSNELATASPYGFPQFNSQTRVESIQPVTADSITTILTPRLQKLGWMDTRNVLGAPGNVSKTLDGTDGDEGRLASLWQTVEANIGNTTVPKIFMGMIMLPPAYKTEQYFRLVINHSFSFAKFRGASMRYDNAGMVANALGVYNFNEDPSKSDPDSEVVKDDAEQ